MGCNKDSVDGFLVNTSSMDCKGAPFRGEWKYNGGKYANGWIKDKRLRVTELGTTGK